MAKYGAVVDKEGMKNRKKKGERDWDMIGEEGDEGAGLGAKREAKLLTKVGVSTGRTTEKKSPNKEFSGHPRSKRPDGEERICCSGR